MAPMSRLVLTVISTLMFAFGSLPDDAEARPVRGTTRTHVNPNISHTANVSRNTNVNRNVNVDRNVNVNRSYSRDIDVDVDHHWGGGYWDHPVAAAAAVTAGVAVTAAAVGTIVRALPGGCSVSVVNNVTYQNCGGVWYAPRYSGTQVTYMVVNAP